MSPSSTHGREGQRTTGDQQVPPAATRTTVVSEAKSKLNDSYGKLKNIVLTGLSPVDLCKEARDAMKNHLAIVAECDKNLVTRGWKPLRERDCEPNVFLAHLDMFLRVYMSLCQCDVVDNSYTKEFFDIIQKATASSGHAGLKRFLQEGSIDLTDFLKPHVGRSKTLKVDALTEAVVVDTDTIKAEVQSISHLRKVLHFIIVIMYMLLDTRIEVRQHMKDMHTSVDLFCDTVLRIGKNLIDGVPAYYFAVKAMQEWLDVLLIYFTNPSRRYKSIVTLFNVENVQFAQHLSFSGGDATAEAHVKQMAHLGEAALSLNAARKLRQANANAVMASAASSAPVAPKATAASRTLAALVQANAARNKTSSRKAKKSASSGKFSYKDLQIYASKNPAEEVMNDTTADDTGCTYLIEEVGENGATTSVKAKVCHVAAANGQTVKNLMGGACPDFTCKNHNAVYGTRTAFTAPASKTTATGEVVKGEANGCITNASKSYLVHTFT